MTRRLIDLPPLPKRGRVDPIEHADMVPTAIDLPAPPILEAGVNKFFEMAKLYWPAKGGVIAFDSRNRQQLAMALGLVYLAMKEMDDAP